MKAVVMTAPGGPEVLKVQHVPEPDPPKAREILVHLKAAGVNPVDTKLRSRGTYYPDRMPCVLGRDGAGVVEATGEQVSRFKPGHEVYFRNGGIGGTSGNYAEYAVVDERFAAKKPESIGFAVICFLLLATLSITTVRVVSAQEPSGENSRAGAASQTPSKQTPPPSDVSGSATESGRSAVAEQPVVDDAAVESEPGRVSQTMYQSIRTATFAKWDRRNWRASTSSRNRC